MPVLMALSYQVQDFGLEIISESTRRKDYIKKLQKYADAELFATFHCIYPRFLL